MKNYKRLLWTILLLDICAIGYYGYSGYMDDLPNDIKLKAGTETVFNFSIPANAYIHDKEVNLNQPFTLSAGETGNYNLDIKLFGVIPLKSVDVKIVDESYAVPSGNPVGIYIETDGVMVIDTGEITGQNGTKIEPAENIVKAGDYITKVNDIEVSTKKELMDIISNSNGEPMVLDIKRNNEIIQCKVTPVMSDNGTYKVGIWVRDDMQGIGTLTYITADNFGALGHSINDIDTGEQVDVSGGSIYKADIINIVPGKAGEPGEIEGIINYEDENIIGYIDGNTNYGIYGTLKEGDDLNIEGEAMPIGLKQEVKKGKAYIRSCITGTSKDYEIEIVDINLGKAETTKGMEILVVDEELCDLTGGIIQGMSGSPIIQDGKIIGAVTHVFVQDSRRGYAAFVENMLSTAKAE